MGEQEFVQQWMKVLEQMEGKTKKRDEELVPHIAEPAPRSRPKSTVEPLRQKRDPLSTPNYPYGEKAERRILRASAQDLIPPDEIVGGYIGGAGEPSPTNPIYELEQQQAAVQQKQEQAALPSSQVGISIADLARIFRPISLVKPIIGTQIPASASLIGTVVRPRNPPAMLLIYIAMDTAGTATIVRRSLDNNNFLSSENLNGIGGSLLAKTGYFFDVPVDIGEAIDITYSATAVIEKVAVWEPNYLAVRF